MKFSQKIGKTPLTKEIQLESIDNELRNGLWNIHQIFIFPEIFKTRLISNSKESKIFTIILWDSYFKKSTDDIPEYSYAATEIIKGYFFSCKWYEVYDFIEFNMLFIKKYLAKDEILFRNYNTILESFNSVLEREFAGYRFIDGVLSPITNITEIQEIETSLSTTESFTALQNCNIHLKDALNKLSDRNNPDYRNSIKEAISAVECVAKIISKNAKDSLGGALDKIKGKIKIHQALERGFKQLYGYTSDEGGIRHCLTDESMPCDFEDAKFMLVSCSAFINYLVVKADKAGIDIKS